MLCLLMHLDGAVPLKKGLYSLYGTLYVTVDTYRVYNRIMKGITFTSLLLDDNVFLNQPILTKNISPLSCVQHVLKKI